MRHRMPLAVSFLAFALTLVAGASLPDGPSSGPGTGDTGTGRRRERQVEEAPAWLPRVGTSASGGSSGSGKTGFAGRAGLRGRRARGLGRAGVGGDDGTRGRRNGSAGAGMEAAGKVWREPGLDGSGGRRRGRARGFGAGWRVTSEGAAPGSQGRGKWRRRRGQRRAGGLGHMRSPGCGKATLTSGSRTIKSRRREPSYISGSRPTMTEATHTGLIRVTRERGTMQDIRWRREPAGPPGRTTGSGAQATTAPSSSPRRASATAGRFATETDADDEIKLSKADLLRGHDEVFALGFSYGGGMSYALACARPTVFRGGGD